jgi:hypothetical protein
VAHGQTFVFLEQLLTVDEQVRCAIYQGCILRSIKFEEMHDRYERVHDAHQDTFKWIYETIDMTRKIENGFGSILGYAAEVSDDRLIRT